MPVFEDGESDRDQPGDSPETRERKRVARIRRWEEETGLNYADELRDHEQTMNSLRRYGE